MYAWWGLSRYPVRQLTQRVKRGGAVTWEQIRRLGVNFRVRQLILDIPNP